MKILAGTLLFLVVVPVLAQTRTFQWDDEVCKFSGTYDAKKYTPEQLRDMLKLFRTGGFSFSTNTTVFAPSDISKLDVAALDSEYKTMTKALKALDIVKTQYWENQRKMKLREIEQVYTLSRISMQGYTSPIILNTYAGAEQCKLTYASPLIVGGDQLLSTWRQVNVAARFKNGDPDRVRRTYEAQYASPDRMKYALVEVLTFGWWNCANDAIGYVKYDGTQDREFKKLFIRVRKLHCDEP